MVLSFFGAMTDAEITQWIMVLVIFLVVILGFGRGLLK